MKRFTLAAVPAPVSAEAGRGVAARQSLLAAAVEVFGERGLEAATTRDIAQRAGQNIATIAYHFGNKEGLYLGVAEHIAGLLLKRTEARLAEAERLLARPKASPSELLDAVTGLLAANVATNREMLPVTAIIVREQQHPTRAFSILYDGALERLQRVGARLVAAYAGLEPDSQEGVVRFHALLGESLAFRFARETILRRAGWATIGEDEDAAIKTVVTEHATWVLQGLRARGRAAPSKKTARRPAGRPATTRRRTP